MFNKSIYQYKVVVWSICVCFKTLVTFDKRLLLHLLSSFDFTISVAVVLTLHRPIIQNQMKIELNGNCKHDIYELTVHFEILLLIYGNTGLAMYIMKVTVEATSLCLIHILRQQTRYVARIITDASTF